MPLYAYFEAIIFVNAINVDLLAHSISLHVS